MKLDKRIKDRNYIFDCFNAEEAKQHIGEKCYMANTLELYKDLSKVHIYRLDSIDEDSYFYNEEENEYFDFCLPVREVLKYMPFNTYTELEKQGITTGKVITFRNNNYPEVIRSAMIDEITYNQENKELVDITLGAIGYEFNTLWLSYSFLKDGEWIPFGVESDI